MKRYAVIHWTYWDGGGASEFDTLEEAQKNYAEACSYGWQCSLVEVLTYNEGDGTE